MMVEVVQALKRKRWFKKTVMNEKDIPRLVEKLFVPGGGSNFRELRAGNIIEFGRIVHAEMSALMDAARRGVSIQDTSLVCTTFPCHMCARHILASGVKRVVFIEPYPKSLTAELYPESVAIDPADVGDERCLARKVAFSSFIGISPNKFADLFKHKKGKDVEGFAVKWTPSISAIPRLAEPEPLIPDLEAITIGRLAIIEEQALRKVRISARRSGTTRPK